MFRISFRSCILFIGERWLKRRFTKAKRKESHGDLFAGMQCAMKKIIFLDVDGVLNNETWAMEMYEQGTRVYREDMLYEPSLEQLRRIVKSTGALIVVSSAWRQIPTSYLHLCEWLRKIDLEVYDKTPYVGGDRGDDITAWFRRHPGEWVYVILDDDNGTLIYEGFTVNHKAYGSGTSFYPDGKPKQEGIWGIKGLLVGREYYSNGQMRFEGVYRLNQAYGPNEPVFGSYYSSEGELKYYGKFQIFHGSVGYPMVGIPEGFGPIQRAALPEKNLFLWDDARKLMHRKSKTAERPVGEEKK